MKVTVLTSRLECPSCHGGSQIVSVFASIDAAKRYAESIEQRADWLQEWQEWSTHTARGYTTQWRREAEPGQYRRIWTAQEYEVEGAHDPTWDGLDRVKAEQERIQKSWVVEEWYDR